MGDSVIVEQNCHAPKVDEHEVKAEMMKMLSPYYDHHDMSLFGKLKHFISHLSESHHAKINTSNFKEQTLDSFSERALVSRTVFAMKKIKTFNHSFFTEEEDRIIEPLPLGMITYGMKYFFCGGDALILTYMWRNWNFNIKTVALMTGLIGFQAVILQVPNLMNEILIQTPRRRALAKRYIDVYGPQFFHNIVNPNYAIHELTHLQNKMNPD